RHGRDLRHDKSGGGMPEAAQGMVMVPPIGAGARSLPHGAGSAFADAARQRACSPRPVSALISADRTLGGVGQTSRRPMARTASATPNGDAAGRYSTIAMWPVRRGTIGFDPLGQIPRSRELPAG